MKAKKPVDPEYQKRLDAITQPGERPCYKLRKIAHYANAVEIMKRPLKIVPWQR